jgi:Domain of unknown function (DUF6468)
MSGIPFGFIVESGVAILLILTIGYCVILNDKLTKLHADRDSLKQMVSDLLRATDLANSAIKGLREAATEADLTLKTRLQEADRFAVELANHVTAGQAIMERIVRVTDAARKGQSAGTAAAQHLERKGNAQAALDRLAAHQRRRESIA